MASVDFQVIMSKVKVTSVFNVKMVSDKALLTKNIMKVGSPLIDPC